VLLWTRRIWDRAPHCAFTDLIRFGGGWLCCFREAEGHAGDAGRIRILASDDGSAWRPAALISERGVDLRDPKLSVRPGGGLLLVCGGTAAASVAEPRRGDGRVPRQPRASLSTDGARWTRPRPVMGEGDWLWRVTWRRGRAYGISYRVESEELWSVSLAAGDESAGFHEVSRLSVPGMPNEATLRFLPDGRALALVRREGGSRNAWIGASPPPYRRWTWRETGQRIGGPNFIILPGAKMWAAGRRHGPEGPRTAVFRMGPGSLRPVLDLPSGGDTGYPGLAFHRGRLWVSYYSSHEGKTAVYLAVLAFSEGRKK
jgi:hypothetical protein